MIDEPIDLGAFIAPDYTPPQFQTAERVVWRMLWCDQGMANLIEIYKKRTSRSSKPDVVILADFGSDAKINTKMDGNPKNSPPVDTILNIIKQRNYLIDTIIVSHQDEDHWALLKELLETLKKEKKKLKIGNVFVGGSGWKDNATEVMNDVIDHSEKHTWWGQFKTNYNVKKKKTAGFIKYGQVNFRLLVVNGPRPETLKIIQKTGKPVKVQSPANASSAVVAVDWESGGFILPGDATHQTLNDINKLMESWKEKYKKYPLPPCETLSAPHHGSYTTTFSKKEPINKSSGNSGTSKNSKKRKRDENNIIVEPIQKIVEIVQPRRVGISAGMVDKFGHPDIAVVEVFEKSDALIDLGDVHTIVCADRQKGRGNFDEIKYRYATYTTIVSYDSTKEKDNSIVADWIFEVDLLAMDGVEPVDVEKKKIPGAQSYYATATASRSKRLKTAKNSDADNNDMNIVKKNTKKQKSKKDQKNVAIGQGSGNQNAIFGTKRSNFSNVHGDTQLDLTSAQSALYRSNRARR